jgi:hypothetical protein
MTDEARSEIRIADAERAVIAAAEDWHDSTPIGRENEYGTVLEIAIRDLRRLRSEVEALKRREP